MKSLTLVIANNDKYHLWNFIINVLIFSKFPFFDFYHINNSTRYIFRWIKIQLLKMKWFLGQERIWQQWLLFHRIWVCIAVPTGQLTIVHYSFSGSLMHSGFWGPCMHMYTDTHAGKRNIHVKQINLDNKKMKKSKNKIFVMWSELLYEETTFSSPIF